MNKTALRMYTEMNHHNQIMFTEMHRIPRVKIVLVEETIDNKEFLLSQMSQTTCLTCTLLKLRIELYHSILKPPMFILNQDQAKD